MQEVPVSGPFRRERERVLNGFVSPGRIRSGTLSGCVYRSDGSKVLLSERFGGFRGDQLVTANPERLKRPDGASRLPGRGLYLGNFMAGHYGHFLFEGLSTFWIFDEVAAEDFDYFLWHPFAFGDRIPDYAALCLARFGIDRDRIIIVGDEALEVEDLLVPERLARLNHSSDPSLSAVYGRIALTEPAPSRRLYLSRRHFNRNRFQRVVANEVQIEALFRSAGFEIIHPETITYTEQLRSLGGASMIAGLSGSNLLNALFAPRGVRVIELGDPRYNGTPNPCIPPALEVAGATGVFIPFKGRLFGPRLTMLFDIDYLATALRPILEEDEGAPALVPPGFDLSALAEIVYRSLRPTVGHLSRNVANRVRRASLVPEPG